MSTPSMGLPREVPPRPGLRPGVAPWAPGWARTDRAAAVALVALVLGFNAPYFPVPQFWDSLWIVPGAEYLREHGFRPVLPAAWDSEGHPVLFHEVLAFAWTVLGPGLWVSHLVVAGFAVVAVLYTYRVARLLYGPTTGLIAALLLLFYPLFRAQGTVVVLDLPVTAFALMAVYYLLEGRTAPYLASATAMVLTKGTIALLVAAILAYLLVKSYPPRSWSRTAATLAVHAIPLAILAGWFWYHKQTGGWWPFVEDGQISPRGVLAMYLPPAIFTRGGALYQAAKLGWHSFGGMTPVGFLTVVFVARWVPAGALLRAGRRSFSARGVLDAFLAERPWSSWGPRGTLVLLGLPIGLHLLFMASTTQLQRYLLPEYALFFILAAKALRDTFRPGPATLAAAGAVLLVFALGWAGSGPGDQLASPSSLAYLDFVAAHREAASFIEDRYPGRTTLAGWPQYIEMSMPSLGYVRRPQKVVAYALPLRYAAPRMLALGAASFSDPRTLTADDFDLVYYSDHTGHPDAPILRDVIRRFALPVLAEFRVGDERATIYANPRRLGRAGIEMEGQRD